MTRLLALASVALAALAVAGCDDHHTVLPLDIEVVVERPDAAPAAASVTAELFYEDVATKRARLDQDAAAASVTVDAALVSALDPAAFARIAHFTDVQIREERGFLYSKAGQGIVDLLNTSYTPTEGAKRQPLQETNSPFFWLATVLSVNALHAQRPIDVALHTGDSVEIGLRSELEHFVHVGRKFAMPFLVAAGNHDTLGFGIWTTREPFLGVELDSDAHVRTAAAATFTANEDRLVLTRPAHAQAFRDISTALGPHGPTQAAFGSAHFGLDLAPAQDDIFYAVQVKAPAPPQPGLRLIILETTRDRGGADAHIDDRQLDFLNDALDASEARASLVVVAAHHPLIEVHRDDGGLGTPTRTREADALREVHDMLVHYPNVVLYLCGHTHLPDIRESRDPGSGALRWTQIDSGSLLIHPQEGSIVELVLDGGVTQATLRARKLGPAIVSGSALAQRVAESRAAAAQDAQSRPRYTLTGAYEATKPLPAFPVTVTKFSR